MDGGGGGGGGPAPFLLKTYDMIDDPTTDDIVSWSSNNSSFVVWNPPEFSSVLLPTYFKHNNFSSFIRQLNTYGFRKIDPERWEFANDEFVKGKKHLLKNIHRRKPIHSHSHPPINSALDPERTALEEEIERLSQEKKVLQNSIWNFQQQEIGTESLLENLEQRVQGMEQRQQKMKTFLQKAMQNPTFIEHLIRMAGANSIDFSVISKKRRQLPREEDDKCLEHGDSDSFDDYSSNSKGLEFGHMFPQDFSSKLRLELSPAVSDGNLVSPSAQSCSEHVGRQFDGTQLRRECLSFVPEVAENMDTGASLCPRKNISLPWQAGVDELDGHISCHLNLTLASAPLEFDRSPLEKDMNSTHNVANSATGLGSSNIDNEHDALNALFMAKKDKDNVGGDDARKASLREPRTNNNQESAPVAGKNDVFWEQFLTERPGSSDNGEASSLLRSNPPEEKREDREPGKETCWTDRKGIEKLTL